MTVSAPCGVGLRPAQFAFLPIRWPLLLAIATVLSAAEAPELLFNGLSHHCVPEGTPHLRRSSKTVEDCQSACARDERCKASSSRVCILSKRAERLRLTGAGLSIVPKPGLVSSFKHSAYPPRPQEQ
jgi:hypothetical protein